MVAKRIKHVLCNMLDDVLCRCFIRLANGLDWDCVTFAWTGLGPDYMRRAGPIKRAGPSTRDGFLFAIT